MPDTVTALAPPATHEGTAYLARVGQRVRQVRALRGMSRRILAAASGVSERYLAQLEAGKGNASLLLLKAIAAAMHVAVDDLVDEVVEQPPAYLLLREHLRGADSAELARLARVVGSGAAPAERRRCIALIGLRGAGKSTLGAALARRLRLPFVELVREIERHAGMAVGEILARGGQPAYRRAEREALAATLQRFERAVIAVGGSLVSEPATYEFLLASCYTVWLKATPREHMERVVRQGDYRPMAEHRNAMADLKRILAERTPLYARADAIVDTAGLGIDAALARLLALEAVGTAASAAAGPSR